MFLERFFFALLRALCRYFCWCGSRVAGLCAGDNTVLHVAAGAAAGAAALALLKPDTRPEVEAKYAQFWPRKIMILFGPP